MESRTGCTWLDHKQRRIIIIIIIIIITGLSRELLEQPATTARNITPAKAQILKLKNTTKKLLYSFSK